MGDNRINIDPMELEPLEDLSPRRPSRINPRRQSSQRHDYRACYRAPLRVARLLLLLILLPTLFILVPLYMRYRVFSSQMYPMGMTDMRLIDSKISPTWCQRQVVKSNTTFNAFVVPGQPSLADELIPVSMTRDLELEDDMKEYWGFYLLQGSTVTVSPCVRWPGASLIMIKGYKHLKECAYIGDDSSEELDELLEANKLGLLSNITLLQKILELNKADGKANDPGTMKRHKAGVTFHDPAHAVNDSTPEVDTANEEVEHDPKELREILDHLHAIRQAIKDEKAKHYRPPEHIVALPGLHRHRDTNVDRDERRWLSFKDLDGKSNSTENNSTEAQNNTESDGRFDLKLDINTTKLEGVNEGKVEEKENIIEVEEERNQQFGEVTTIVVATEYTTKTKAGEVVTTTEASEDDNVTTEKADAEANSKEIFEDVLNRLQALGEKGQRVLKRLHDSMGHGKEYEQQLEDTLNKTTIMSQISGSDEELDRLRRILVEAIDEEKTSSVRRQKRRDAANEARIKRELMLGAAKFERELNEDDEARDFAAEEGVEPDGYAEHHTILNETTPLDMSNSEFWSSFSSSEEALLECDGLILHLPLTPSQSCDATRSDKDKLNAAQRNAVTYRVPANGYYFFVFNSENEVQTNYISVKFDLQKTRYDIARTAVRECRNSTDRCDLLLDIFSSQKVVLELPLRDNQSLWNEQFVVISECEPRTSVYLACVIAVPIFIMVFAFQ